MEALEHETAVSGGEINDLTHLRELKRAVTDAINLWRTLANQENLPGVPHHAANVFLMEPGTNRYRGNLCHYAQCPKDKPECEVAGCGAQPFLDLLGVAASRPSAAIFLFLVCRRECGALPRRRYGDLPFIKPHPPPVRSQPLRDGAHDCLVLRAVTQEHVMGKCGAAHV